MSATPLLHDVSGTGEPIVLVPGGLSGWRSWVPFVEPLARDHTVVRVQLRSIELTEAGAPYPPDYGTLDEREGLRATLDHLGLDRVHLAGWSYGGHVALDFALEYPERARTLTLIEPHAVWVLRETGHDPDALARSEAFDRSWAGRQITPDDFKRFLVRAGLAREGDDLESQPGWPGWVANRQVITLYGTAWDYTNSLDRLRALDVPVLAVKGSEATGEDRAIVDALAATMPNVRLLELPGDHASHLQNMDRFIAELTAHVASESTRPVRA